MVTQNNDAETVRAALSNGKALPQVPTCPSTSATAADTRSGAGILASGVSLRIGDIAWAGVAIALYPPYVRGEAYLEERQGRQATAEFQKLIDHRGVVLNFVLGALAHLQLGRAKAMTGDKEGARAAYQDFLTLARP